MPSYAPRPAPPPGHAYYFLEDVYPRMTGRRPLRTPGLVRALVGQGPHIQRAAPAAQPPPPPAAAPWDPAAVAGAGAGAAAGAAAGGALAAVGAADEPPAAQAPAE